MDNINPLAGLPLDYVIGKDGTRTASPGRICEQPYDAGTKPDSGLYIKYGNLFNEYYKDQSAHLRAYYGPYLHDSSTAEEYDEGEIDPKGLGWMRNLNAQFILARRQQYDFIELDNPDAYSWPVVKDAIDKAASYNLKVIAKNPNACDFPAVMYLAHPNIYGCIVEYDSHVTPLLLDGWRQRAGKPHLPVWFISFGTKRWWTVKMGKLCDGLTNMGVTFSPRGEYASSVDIFVPKKAT